MSLKKTGIWVVVALAGVVALFVEFRQELATVPRIRVGPLHRVEPEPASLRLFVLGDTGSGNDNQYRVAAAMEARCREQGGLDAILLLGDNSYQSGFASVEDPQWQTKVEKPYGTPCLSQAPIYPVLGNHDYKVNPSSQIEYSLVNPRWRMPNRFYSVSFGKLLNLVAFDSQLAEFCFRPAFCTLDYLFESLRRGEQEGAAWTLVIAHHPIASSSGHGHGHGGGGRGVLLEPLLCNRIDAWLAGHAHHLEHRMPEGCRMELFVSGGGGGDLYEAEPAQGEAKFVQSKHGFLEVELDGAEMRSRFVDQEGSVLYETRKSRHGAGHSVD